MLKLQANKHPNGTPVVAMHISPEVVAVQELLRTLKAMFPEIYARVYVEIQPCDANGKPKFEVPDRIKDDESC